LLQHVFFLLSNQLKFRYVYNVYKLQNNSSFCILRGPQRNVRNVRVTRFIRRGESRMICRRQ